MAPVSFEYFGIQGRGEPIRLMLADLEIEYEEVGNASFVSNKTDLDSYTFGQIPRLMIDGKSLVQTNAILEFLAARAGKLGADPYARYQVSSFLCALEDFAIRYGRAVYTNAPNNKADLVTFATEEANRVFTQFEAIAAKSTTEYLFGAEPSHAEYHGLYLISCIELLRPSVFAEGTAFPLLGAWYKKMLARKNIAAYMASGKQFTQRNGNATADGPVC
ncbi:hypothetical protein RQP46_001788 [Phenoliferia psychrophenolica]